MPPKPLSEKVFWTALLLTLSVGYAFALAQIFVTAGITPSSILQHYQGNEEEMMFGLSFKQLIKLSHIHMLGMPLIVAPTAWLYVEGKWGESWKSLVIGLTFAGMVLDISSWWGVRYVGAPALPFLFAGGAFMAGGFGLMTAQNLIALWRRQQ